MERYDRQVRLDEIGPAGQQKLRAASVLVVGVGGLGSPISLYLAGAGVGRIGLVDDDVVSIHNLHRQVLYGEDQVGQSKACCAAERLGRLNSEVQIEPHAMRLTEENAEALISRYDLVVDGCDNYDTRYLIDRTCGKLGKPYIYGAICGFTGQVSVFHYGPNPLAYTDLYPEPPSVAPDRRVIGPTPGITGAVEAHEAIKVICGFGDVLARRLWMFDLRTMHSEVVAW